MSQTGDAYDPRAAHEREVKEAHAIGKALLYYSESPFYPSDDASPGISIRSTQVTAIIGLIRKMVDSGNIDGLAVAHDAIHDLVNAAKKNLGEGPK